MALSAQNDIILERAKAASLSRDYEQAAKLYRGLLKSDPKNLELLNALAESYVKSGNDSQAVPLYNEILRLDEHNVMALNEIGAAYRRMKKYDESIAALERAIILDETNIQIFYNLGFTYKLMGKYNDAIQCFKNVISENPSDVLAFNHLGSIYALQNNHREAVNAYLHGLKVDANHPVLHLNLAKSYEALGEYDKAGSEYEAALRTKPGWMEAMEGYADLLLNENKVRAAGDIVKKAVDLNPDNNDIRTKLGTVYSREQEYESAEKEFIKVLNVDSDHRKALSGLADAYEAQGKNDDAVRVMTHAEELAPEDSDVLRQSAHVLISANKLNTASQKIKKVWDKNPDDVRTLNLLGQYYIVSGDEGKVAGCYRRISDINPEYKDHLRDGAKRYGQKGEYQKAEHYLDSYMRSRPDDTIAATLLGQVYEAQEKYAQALAQYKKLTGINLESRYLRAAMSRVRDKLDMQEMGSVSPVPVAPAASAPSEEDYVPFPEESAVNEIAAPDVDMDIAPDFAESADSADVSEDALDLSGLSEADENIDALDNALLDSQEVPSTAVPSDTLDTLLPDDDSAIENALDDMFADGMFGTTSADTDLPGETEDGMEFAPEDIFSNTKSDDGTVEIQDALDDDLVAPAEFEIEPEMDTEPDPAAGIFSGEQETEEAVVVSDGFEEDAPGDDILPDDDADSEVPEETAEDALTEDEEIQSAPGEETQSAPEEPVPVTARMPAAENAEDDVPGEEDSDETPADDFSGEGIAPHDGGMEASVFSRTEEISALLRKLVELSECLPEDEYETFRSSREYGAIESLMESLSSRPGSGFVDRARALAGDRPVLSGNCTSWVKDYDGYIKKLSRTVLNSALSLSEFLPDNKSREELKARIKAVLVKIE